MSESTPVFPLRIIFEDGELVEIEEADQLFDHFTVIDSTDPASGVIIRDQLDRIVKLIINGEQVQLLEAVVE
jgi:hypothetical protein